MAAADAGLDAPQLGDADRDDGVPTGGPPDEHATSSSIRSTVIGCADEHERAPGSCRPRSCPSRRR